MSAAVRVRRAEAGFSLLEVLVAFAILALTLGVLMQIFSKAMTVTTLGGDYSRAAAFAEARLNSIGFEIPLEPGVYNTESEEGFAATVQILPYALGQDFPGEPLLQPYLVVVDVLWKDGGGTVRRLSLPSLRLADPQQPGGTQ